MESSVRDAFCIVQFRASKMQRRENMTILLLHFLFGKIGLQPKGFDFGLYDFICEASTSYLGGASPLQTSPHKGSAPCESPEKALRGQDSAVKAQNNLSDCLSRDSAS